MIPFGRQELYLKFIPGNIEDIERRRKAVGLEPLADYLEKIKKTYKQ